MTETTERGDSGDGRGANSDAAVNSTQYCYRISPHEDTVLTTIILHRSFTASHRTTVTVALLFIMPSPARKRKPRSPHNTRPIVLSDSEGDTRLPVIEEKSPPSSSSTDSSSTPVGRDRQRRRLHPPPPSSSPPPQPQQVRLWKTARPIFERASLRPPIIPSDNQSSAPPIDSGSLP